MVRVIEYTIENDGEPVVYRLITSLLDVVAFPALVLAMEYHKRWEVENTLDELKVHLLGRKTLIRSLNPHSALQLLRHILVTKTRQFDDTTDRNSLIAVTQN